MDLIVEMGLVWELDKKTYPLGNGSYSRVNSRSPVFNEYTNLNLESFKYEITKLKLYEIMISINLKINKKYKEICMEEIK